MCVRKRRRKRKDDLNLKRTPEAPALDNGDCGRGSLFFEGCEGSFFFTRAAVAVGAAAAAAAAGMFAAAAVPGRGDGDGERGAAAFSAPPVWMASSSTTRDTSASSNYRAAWRGQGRQAVQGVPRAEAAQRNESSFYKEEMPGFLGGWWEGAEGAGEHGVVKVDGR